MWYFVWYINCCVVLSCGNGQKNHRNGQKTTGMGKKPQEWAKNHRNSLWFSYGTLIVVWYCPMVINGQKNHRNGQKKTQE